MAHHGSELILGGQRSGKSRCAEQRAVAWLATGGHSAVLLVTAVAGDDEMGERIARHRRDRAERVPRLATEEVPFDLAEAINGYSAAGRLVVVDCLTLWATNVLMPSQGPAQPAGEWASHIDALCLALTQAAGPVVLVSNEIGWGVSPMTSEARHFVDELGRLHQVVAACCARVTLMVAGLEVPVKSRL